MRKFIGVVAVVACVACLAWTVLGLTSHKIRLSAQSQVTAYRTFHLIWDSTGTLDTHLVDTVYTETLALGDYKYLHFKTGWVGFSLIDSANDSIVSIWHTMMFNNEVPWFDTIVSFDTLLANGAYDSTDYVNDSVLLTNTAFTHVYWRVIVKDSVVSDGVPCTDTIDLRWRMEAVQSDDRGW